MRELNAALHALLGVDTPCEHGCTHIVAGHWTALGASNVLSRVDIDAAAQYADDRRTDTGACLSEVRTVLSRAETAAYTLSFSPFLTDEDYERGEMVEALGQCVVMLRRWRGKRKSRAARWQRR